MGSVPLNLKGRPKTTAMAGGSLFSGSLLFSGPFFNDTIVFDRAPGAGANLSASWISSHRKKIMRSSPMNGKERVLRTTALRRA
jgi:hypothetical protein